MAYSTVTLAQLRALLEDRWDGTPFWSVPEADIALNEGISQYALATGFWKQRVTLTTVANQVYYTVDGSLLYGLRVEWAEYPVIWESVDAIDLGRPNWEAERTTTGRPVPRRVVKWIPRGLRTLALWPADGTGGNILVLDGVRVAPVLTSANATLDLGPEDLDALLGYALGAVSFNGPRDRWRTLSASGLRTFYRAAARHNPRLLAVPALQTYFDQQADPRRTTRPPTTLQPASAADTEAR